MALSAQNALAARTMASLPFPLTTNMIRGAKFLSPRLRALQKFRGISNTPLGTPTQTQGTLPTSQSPIVSKLHFFNSVTPDGSQIPTYRVLDGSGKPIEGAEMPDVCINSLRIYHGIQKPCRSTNHSLVDCGSDSTVSTLIIG